jgi:hypothetical protein
MHKSGKMWFWPAIFNRAVFDQLFLEWYKKGVIQELEPQSLVIWEKNRSVHLILMAQEHAKVGLPFFNTCTLYSVITKVTRQVEDLKKKISALSWFHHFFQRIFNYFIKFCFIWMNLLILWLIIVTLIPDSNKVLYASILSEIKYIIPSI